MKFGKTLMAAAAASVMMIGAASADWDGPYFGTFAGVTLNPGGASVLAGNVGLTGGFNLVPGNFLVGIRMDAGASLIGPTLLIGDVMTSVRIGGFISPDVLLYGTAGYGTHYPYIAGTSATMFGLGAEIAIGESLSLFGEVRRYNTPGGPPVNALPAFMFGMNINK
jgi:hypothetical protein